MAIEDHDDNDELYKDDETQRAIDRGDYLEEDDIPEDEEELEEESEEEDEESEEPEESEEYEDEEEDPEDEEDEEDYEDEATQDDEEVEEDEEEGTEEDDAEAARIPRTRLNKVIEERNAERERAARLEGRLEALIESLERKPEPESAPEPEVPQYDFSTKETEYIELILEGETDKAIRLRGEIDAARKAETERLIQETKESATKEAVKVTETAKQEELFELVIEDSMDTYSFLDDASKDYNERAVTLINTAMKGYIADGENKAQALQKAVEEIAPLFETENKVKQTESLGKKRTKTTRKKAVKAAEQQPPEHRRGAKGQAKRDLDTLDISKLSEAEYNKLTLRERKALRGD